MIDYDVGTYASPHMLSIPHDERASLVRRVEDAGLAHLFVGDHVSFHNGFGMDGLIDAATLTGMSETLNVVIGVYILPLRHPVPVARQLASLARSAPGRVAVGVGIGGEDRHEMTICGTDPATRGRLTNHALDALRGLLSGEPTDYACEFFEFEGAQIAPAPTPALPFMIGGRSDAAIRRTAAYGDGWLGLWCSAKRFGQVAAQARELADEAGRGDVAFRHGLQVWVGFGEKSTARGYIAERMGDMYQMPFEPFERYSPYGSALEVAEFLAPYVEQGAAVLNVTPCGESLGHEIDMVAEVKSLLDKEFAA